MTPVCAVHGCLMSDETDPRDDQPVWACPECPERCLCAGSDVINRWCPNHGHLIVEPAELGLIVAPTAPRLWAVAA